eukprot:g4991.t1
MSNSTVSPLGREDSPCSQLASWENASQVMEMDSGTQHSLIADLSPVRFEHRDIHRSISDKASEMNCPTECTSSGFSLTHRSSDAANNSAVEEAIGGEEIKAGKLEALRNEAKRNLREELLTTKQNQDANEEFANAFLTAFDHYCMASRKPSKKLMELLLLHKDSAYGDNESYTAPFESYESPVADGKTYSSWLSLDNETMVDSMEQDRYSQDSWSHWGGDGDKTNFDCNSSLVSEDSRVAHRRTWSTEPLDSFIDGTQTKARCLRTIGNQRQCLKNTSVTKSNTDDDLSKKSLIFFRKLSDPSKKPIMAYKRPNEVTISERVCKGLLSAGRQFLQSVWTWTVVAILVTGVHFHSKRGLVEIDMTSQMWTQENDAFNFEWDDDVDFTSGASDEE